MKILMCMLVLGGLAPTTCLAQGSAGGTVLSMPVVAPTWFLGLCVVVLVLQVVLVTSYFWLRSNLEQKLETSVKPLQASIDQINSSLTPILTLVANRVSSTAQYPFAPQITDLSPDRGRLAGNTRVEIAGRNFSPDMQVWFGSTRAPLQPEATTTKLVVNAPPGAPGEVDIYLVSASGVMSQRAVTYRYVDFHLGGVNHAHGRLRLNGAGFTAQTQVWVDNQQIQPVQFDNEGRIEVAQPPPHAHHIFAVVAVNPGGDRSEPRTYHHG